MSQLRTLFLAGALSLCIGCQPPDEEAANGNANVAPGEQATLPSSRDLTKIEILEVPETGIQLGWGYNLYDAAPLPNQCVVFTLAEEPAQTRTMTMKEVTDTYELQQRMNISAEASVKAMGVEGKGKASFAKNVNLSGSSIHFLLDASVDNGVRYAAPYVADESQRADRQRGPAIRLTEAAEQLAEDPDEFLRQCGTGFVSAVYSGASINAIVSIVTSSRKEKQDIRAEVEAKGWGATAKGSTHMGSETSASSNEKSITVLMVGGRGDSIPKNQEELEGKLETLSYSAYEAPKDFRMAVTPYESLPNWPQDRELSGDSAEMEQLAGLYGDYTTLYDEIEYILVNPAMYAAVRRTDDDTGEAAYSTVPMIADDGGAMELRYLESLQDYVQASLRKLEGLAIGCLAVANDTDDGQDCVFDESAFIDSYALRSQLPLRFPLTEEISTTTATDCSKLKGLNKLACERTAKLNELKKVLDESPALDEQVTEFWILSKSRSRCRLSITDIGCLSNEEARNWRDKVGRRLLILPEEKRAKLMGVDLTFDKHSATWVDAATYATMIETLSAN